ncbi:hypothetical protein GMES_0929 [Paraglaciecola mesophila KMM 241]|uniref:Uncharacterized protein n=1 Tax=Paraglaciecola mesophila KMM 241 TaxID=1128912 RepID=K6XRI3_9ALTE|nr:hypothetical protein GMES_0929 [Paraglaciecola mesophila KMM 241]
MLSANRDNRGNREMKENGPRATNIENPTKSQLEQHLC